MPRAANPKRPPKTNWYREHTWRLDGDTLVIQGPDATGKIGHVSTREARTLAEEWIDDGIRGWPKFQEEQGWLDENPKAVITHAEGGAVFDDAFVCAHETADMFGADVQFEHYDADKPESDTLVVKMKFVPRVPKQRHLSLVENPKTKGFDADQVEKMREAFEYCIGNKLESRRMWARYEPAKPSPRAVPIKMTIRKREARQSDLFGNPFYMEAGRLYQQTVEPDDLYFVPVKKAKNGNWTGIMVRIGRRGGTAKATQTSIDPYGARLWQAIDPVNAPAPVVRAFESRGVRIGDSAANPSDNLADLRFDGRIAQQRYRDIRSGAVKIYDSIEDRRTGAYMALLLEQDANEPEIFHIEPDGFVYVIEYESNREAQEDWDSLLSRFPRRNAKNPCGCKHARGSNPLAYHEIPGGLSDAPSYQTDPIEIPEHYCRDTYTGRCVGVIRLSPTHKPVRGDYRVVKVGKPKRVAYRATFFEIDPDAAQPVPFTYAWGPSTVSIVSDGLLSLADAKRAVDAWLGSKMFYVSEGKLEITDEPIRNPRQRNPRQAKSGRRLGAL